MAGAKILEVYGRDFEVEYKGDDSPLTEADKAANQVIMAFLDSDYPEIPVISEENREVAYGERRGWRRFWLVDPLDGTKEFIKKNDEFTVNIALVENGQPVLGVVYQPVNDTLYLGAENAGAWRIEKGGHPQVIVGGPHYLEKDQVQVVASRSHLTPEVEAFVARKTVGSFVEIAGWATLHLSPVTVLAIFSDLAYGSKTYLNELSGELKAKGVIDPETTIDQVSDLLDAISKTSGMTAQAFDMPPISVEGLKKTVEQTRQAIAKTSPTQLIPQSEVKRLWNEMKETAEQQEVNLLSISSTMTLYTLNKVGAIGKGTLSAVTVAGNMFDRHILDHYRSGLGDIRSRGVYMTLSENSQPYMAAAWNNFSTSKPTITEDLLSGALFARGWRAVCGWFRRRRNRKNKVPKQAEVPAGDENEPA